MYDSLQSLPIPLQQLYLSAFVAVNVQYFAFGTYDSLGYRCVKNKEKMWFGAAQGHPTSYDESPRVKMGKMDTAAIGFVFLTFQGHVFNVTPLLTRG